MVNLKKIKLFCRCYKIWLFLNRKKPKILVFYIQKKFQDFKNKLCKNEKINGLKSESNLLSEISQRNNHPPKYFDLFYLTNKNLKFSS